MRLTCARLIAGEPLISVSFSVASCALSYWRTGSLPPEKLMSSDRCLADIAPNKQDRLFMFVGVMNTQHATVVSSQVTPDTIVERDLFEELTVLTKAKRRTD